MQPELFEYFAADNYNCFLTDCSITLNDKTDGSHPTRREEYWRKVLKTVAYCTLLYIFSRQESSLRKMYTFKSYLCVL